MLEEAMRYLDRGFAVIPVGTNKKPLIAWKLYQTEHPKPEALSEWFSNGQAQIGVVTGALSGVVVVDVEVGALDQTDQFPYTAMGKSGGGGVHLWYRHPGRPVANAVGFRPGVDIRGDGGYVVVPPSLHQSGRRYQWVIPLEHMVPFPTELLEELEQQRAPTINPPGWIAQALAELHEGNRNATFAKIAGRLRRDDWTAEDILTLLTPHAERSDFPLADLRQEIEGLCRRYPPKNPSPASFPYMEATEMESRPLEALPLASFFAQVAAQIAWVIEGVLPKEGAGIVAGPAGYGKSWMLLDLAVEHTRGGKWLGQFATAQGRVLYLDEESSPALLRHRLTKLLASKGVSAEQLDLHVAVGQGLSFSDPASVERLRQLLDRLRPALVIVDSLIRVHRAEENSASEMAQVFKAVKDLIREFGCAFLFADHQRKPGGFGTSLDLLLRGSSEKAAFVDTLLSLQRKEGTLIVEHSKSRYAEPIPAFVVRIEDVGPEATAVVYGGEAEQIKQAARQEAAREFLAAALSHGEWMARKDLVERAKGAKVSEKALDEVLKALDGLQIEREDRKPETGGRGGKAAYYRWKTDAITSPSPDQETETETGTAEV
jgi:hypothetical protein